MKHPVDLVDFKALLKRLSVLPVFQDTRSLWRGVKLDIGRSRRPGCVSGSADLDKRRLRLVVGPYVHAARVLECFLHELVHLALPAGTNHNARFRLTLVRAAREAWGIHVRATVPRGDQKCSAYALDEVIIGELSTLIETGQIEIPAPPPRQSRAAVQAALVTERAEHALRMHALWSVKLARAKTTERKWRMKVRYYERQAAKAAEKETQ